MLKGLMLGVGSNGGKVFFGLFSGLGTVEVFFEW
jgi:hypothetical protein